MADAAPIPDEAETRAHGGAFDWNALNRAKAAEIIARVSARCYSAAQGASV